MNASIKREQAIFVAAVGQVPPDQWEGYAREACAGDHQLLARVSQLLRAHAEAGSFLDAPALDLGTTIDEPPIREGPGTIIGAYKLLEQIGEGGMGVVWMAEQTRPVRRKVALKVLKAGMDTREVVARFEAERQALALMDHPNITHVFDGGTTASGRPYFVMELVRGVPITAFCDQNHLNVR
jgi:serine/threonine protein kinase